MGMLCSHKWEVKSDKILPSAHEQFMDGVTSYKSGGNSSYPPWAFVKTHIVIMVCSYCGKIYKSVEASKQ